MNENELKSYGVREATQLNSEADCSREEILINGYTIVPGVLEESTLDEPADGLTLFTPRK